MLTTRRLILASSVSFLEREDDPRAQLERERKGGVSESACNLTIKRDTTPEHVGLISTLGPVNTPYQSPPFHGTSYLKTLKKASFYP